MECFQLKEMNIHMWPDSRNALAWILSPPHLWLDFVSHRIAEINRSIPNSFWHHTDGPINPVDLATRGFSTF